MLIILVHALALFNIIDHFESLIIYKYSLVVKLLYILNANYFQYFALILSQLTWKSPFSQVV